MRSIAPEQFFSFLWFSLCTRFIIVPIRHTRPTVERLYVSPFTVSACDYPSDARKGHCTLREFAVVRFAPSSDVRPRTRFPPSFTSTPEYKSTAQWHLRHKRTAKSESIGNYSRLIVE